MQLVHRDMIDSDRIGRVIRVGDDRIAVTIIECMRKNIGDAAECRLCQFDNVRILEKRVCIEQPRICADRYLGAGQICSAIVRVETVFGT